MTDVPAFQAAPSIVSESFVSEHFDPPAELETLRQRITGGRLATAGAPGTP